MYDCWADLVAHLLLLKSSMTWRLVDVGCPRLMMMMIGAADDKLSLYLVNESRIYFLF